MLASRYVDTSSDASAVSTPKRSTINSSGHTGKTPFRSPSHITPLRSPAQPSPFVKQVKRTAVLMNRIFTSNILFIVSCFLLSAVAMLLIKSVWPYIKMERTCPAGETRVRYFCVNNSANPVPPINLSKTITHIVQIKKPKHFLELYNLVNEKHEITEEYFRQVLNYCQEVQLFNDHIFYKLSDYAEIILLWLLFQFFLVLFTLCIIYRANKNRTVVICAWAIDIFSWMLSFVFAFLLMRKRN